MSWSIRHASFPTCRESWTPKWNHKNLPHRHTSSSPGRTKLFNIKNARPCLFFSIFRLSWGTGSPVLSVCMWEESHTATQIPGEWPLMSLCHCFCTIEAFNGISIRAFDHYKSKSVWRLPFTQITYEWKMKMLKNFILSLISGDLLTCHVCTIRLRLIMASFTGLLSEIVAVRDCLLYIQTEHLMTFKSVLFKYNHFQLQGTVQSPPACELSLEMRYTQ